LGKRRTSNACASESEAVWNSFQSGRYHSLDAAIAAARPSLSPDTFYKWYRINVTLPLNPSCIELSITLSNGQRATYNRELRYTNESLRDANKRYARNCECALFPLPTTPRIADPSSNFDRMAVRAKAKAIKIAAAIDTEEQLSICAVCLEPCRDDERARLSGCSHEFCIACISSWCIGHGKRTCPSCRAPTASIIATESGDVLWCSQHSAEDCDNEAEEISEAEFMVTRGAHTYDTVN
jgi:hypothetical protein